LDPCHHAENARIALLVAADGATDRLCRIRHFGDVPTALARPEVLADGHELLGKSPRQLGVLGEHVQDEALGRLFPYTGEARKE
jgi:hypothetical protein